MKFLSGPESMEVNPLKQALRRWQLLMYNDHPITAHSLMESDTQAKVNNLLGMLLKIGWKELYNTYFTVENSSDADEKLMNWMLHGTFDDSCSQDTKKIRAWLAVQRKPNLNRLFDFFRRSNGDLNFADETGQTILHVFLRNCVGYLPKKSALKVVRKLMEIGASVDVVDEDDCTPMHIVAEAGEKALMKLILSSFTNVTAAAGFYGDTVLHDVVYACNEDKTSGKDQYVDIVNTLLTKGANPNAWNKFGITPLQCAVEFNFIEMLLIFQRHGADFRQLTCDGETLLHRACINDRNPSARVKIIDLLVNQGCDVNAKDKSGRSPVHLAATLRSEKIIERLIQLGGDVHLKSKNLHLTPLHLAVSHNQPKNVEILLQAGAYVDAEAKNGVTPLHIAASRDGTKIIKHLVKFGADVHKREKNFYFTPLHIAMSGGKKKAKLLLKKGVVVDAANENGVAPLHLASLMGNAKVVQVLMKYHADVSCRGTTLGLTPLHLAAMNNNIVDVKSLIFNDSDLREKSFFNMFKWISTPTMVGENVAVAEMLLKNGTDVNVKDAIGRTPLHLATLQKTCKMTETLLTFGAHTDEYDADNRTPFHNILESKAASGLDYLLKFGLNVNDEDVVREFDRKGNEIHVNLLIHAMKMKMLGLPVHDDYNCIQDTHIDVKLLKSCMIPGTNISVYKFLHMKQRRQVKYVKNVMSMNLEFEFPTYFNVIHATCCQALNRVALLRPAVSALNSLTGRCWPQICSEHIISYINNRDLRIFIDSAKN